MKIQLNLKTEHSIFGSNKCYGITQDPTTKDFIIIMDNYLLDDLKRYVIDHLLYKSRYKLVDDYFIRNVQVDSNLKSNVINVMEFVPYDKFIYIESESKFSKVYSAYRATWIDGNIQGWCNWKLNFRRRGLMQVVLKKLNNSENITFKELNEVSYILI